MPSNFYINLINI